MNRIFRIIWSKTRHTWVVASENAKRAGKAGGTVDERATAFGLARERDVVEDPPLAFAWQLRLGSLLVLLASCPPAHAIDYYWDVDGGTAGAGGTTPAGTWSTGGATLSTNVNGATATGAVTTTTADRLFFSAGTDATGTYTVTVNGTQNIGRLTFQEGTVNLSGGTINFGAVSGLIDGDATPDTISSVITGTNGVRFSGGTRTLTGTNTYSGQTVLGGSGLSQAAVILAAPGGNAVSGNSLQLGGGNYTSAGFVTLGAAEQINDTATVTLSSGHYSGSSIFSLNGFDETIGGINLGHQGNGSSVTFRNGAATDATVTLVGSGTYTTVTGDRSGGRSLQNGGAGRLNVVVSLTGAGHQTFAGSAPSYTGTTTINSGTLRLWNTSAWSSNAILNGGTLNLHQTATGTPVTAGGNVATRTHFQTISGAGGTLRKTGDGTVVLNGNNTYQGATAIDQGTLRAGSATAFGNNSAVTLANVAGATMALNNFNIAVGSLAGGGTAGGNVTMGSGNLTVGGDNTSTSYGGVISGSGPVIKVGTGTQALTGTNTYTGLTTVNAGTLQLGSGGNTGSIGSVQATVAAGASLAVNRADTFALTQTVTGDGTLVQRGAGATTMTANSDIDHVVLEHGRLVTPGALTSDDITFSNDGGATLQVTGTLQTATAGAALVTGGSSNDTVRIDAGATMLANGSLGDGVDTLDVAGILNTAGGSFDLNGGDDTFIIHDNTNVTGFVLGGAGNDTLTADIAGNATLGAAQTFETLTKTGAGTLDIVGPAISDFSIVNVNAGTLAIGAGATLDAPAGGSLTTTVAGGATLAVAGSYGCGAGNDTLTVAGTVSGSGTIDLCGDDDTLTLADGAMLSNVIAISGGAGTGDLLVLNTANAFGLDGGDAVSFELLQKNDTGTATLTGTHSFAGGTAINGGVLDMDGVVETATVAMADGTVLNVDGTLQAAGATQALISGSAGINTVSVGAGGNLLAAGDLGDGEDVLDLAGMLNTGGGVFMLGGGDDSLRIHDGTNIVGTVDGGAGFDSLDTDIAGIADLGAVSTFEELIKSGAGTLNINGPAPSDFVSVQVQGGSMNIAAAGTLSGVQNATVASGAHLVVDGSFTFTPGADTFTVAGEVRGLSTIDMLDGDDTLTIQDGADLSGLAGPIDGGVGTDTLNADIAGSAALGGAIDFETLIKTNSGAINILGPAPSQFDTVLVQGGTLYVGAGAVVDPETTVVDAGATMTVDGTYNGTLGDDTFTVSGMVNGTGAIDLLAGDDVLTINDGGDLGGLTTPLDGGSHTPAGDSVVLDFASNGTFSGGSVINFENLVKQNAGTVTLTGASAFSGGMALDGGGLIVSGAVETPAITLADGTTLNVDGTLQAAGATQALISGSAGLNTVSVGAGGTLRAAGDLGDGDDVLDVAGTLDVGGGTFLLGGGDDNFVVHDGTVVTGAVDGGAGLDTRTYNINASADLGALLGFEGVTKTGTGVLNITGPGATDLQAVDVLAGRLEVFAGASVNATVGTSLNTVVANGATLHVDGAYGCGSVDDSLVVSGTVSGSGTIDLCGGEDTLTLRDGAVLANTISGGPHGGGDTLALDNAGALSFDASRTINFEFLVKDNRGVATLTGSQDYIGGATLNDGTLSVAGILTAPTMALTDGTVLNVDGTLQAAGATPALITGSAGINTVSVGAGGTLLAAATWAPATMSSTWPARSTPAAACSPSAAVTTAAHPRRHQHRRHGSCRRWLRHFQHRHRRHRRSRRCRSLRSADQDGAGTLDINGPTRSDFVSVQVQGGSMNIAAAGTLSGVQNATVASGAHLVVDGSFTFTPGADTFTVAGEVRGLSTIDMLDGDDTLTIQDGADLSGLAGPIDGGVGTDTLNADIAGTATLGGAINFDTLDKINAGTLRIDGPAPSAFSVVNVDGGTLAIGAASAVNGVAITTVASGATLQVDGSYAGRAGNDAFTLSGALRGVGAIDLLDGDDVFTVNTGAIVAFTGVVDAAAATADRFVLAGTGNDSFDVSLIGPVFRNFDGFSKEGAGTWRLTGTGDRDWTVTEGTLIGDSASFGGDISNFGTVIFDQATAGIFDGVLSGSGTLIKQNAGTLVVSGANTFSGATQIAAGTLQLDGTLPGTLTVSPGATLSGIGSAASVTALAGGFVTPGNPATPFGTLTLTGDYAGGGTVSINAHLGGTGSATSRLAIQGSTSGLSPVLINAASGDGAQTAGDGISIIQVGGVESSRQFPPGATGASGRLRVPALSGRRVRCERLVSALRARRTNGSRPPAPSSCLPAGRGGLCAGAAGQPRVWIHGNRQYAGARRRSGPPDKCRVGSAGGRCLDACAPG